MIDRYDIDRYIAKCCNMNLLEIIAYSEKEFQWLEKRKFSSRESREDEYDIRKYKEFIHEFLYFLYTGIKPSRMPDEDFQRTKPIIEHLILDGYSKEALRYYR